MDRKTATRIGMAIVLGVGAVAASKTAEASNLSEITNPTPTPTRVPYEARPQSELPKSPKMEFSVKDPLSQYKQEPSDYVKRLEQWQAELQPRK